LPTHLEASIPTSSMSDIGLASCIVQAFALTPDRSYKWLKNNYYVGHRCLLRFALL
jgi:hypothetical protein